MGVQHTNAGRDSSRPAFPFPRVPSRFGTLVELPALFRRLPFDWTRGHRNRAGAPPPCDHALQQKRRRVLPSPAFRALGRHQCPPNHPRETLQRCPGHQTLPQWGFSRDLSEATLQGICQTVGTCGNMFSAVRPITTPLIPDKSSHGSMATWLPPSPRMAATIRGVLPASVRSTGCRRVTCRSFGLRWRHQLEERYGVSGDIQDREVALSPDLSS